MVPTFVLGEFRINDDQHLLGDSAYPLKQWLIPPYKDNGQLTEERKIFNRVHSKCRVTIERAFGLLKCRFRRLFYIDSLKPTSIVKYIIASCILHNICLQNDDLMDEDPVIVEEIEDDDDSDADSTSTNMQSAQSKRERLLNGLF